MTPQEKAQAGVKSVYGRIQMGAQTYRGDEVTSEQIAAWVRANNKVPVLLDATVEDWEQAYREALETAPEVLSLHTSAKVATASFENARIAASRIGPQVKVADSMATSYTLGFLVLQAAQLAQAGKSPEEIYAELKVHSHRPFSMYYLRSLEYLAKSGRMGSVAALVTSLLRVRPILKDEDGMMVAHSQTLGDERAKRTLLESLRDQATIRMGEMRVAFVYAAGMEDSARELQERARSSGIRPYTDVGLRVSEATSFALTGPHSVGIVAEFR